jgi:imidazolonepropionase-like amidohydrolase
MWVLLSVAHISSCRTSERYADVRSRTDARCGNDADAVSVAVTRDAAYVCRRQDVLGTFEVGKFADVLVVDGDPLEDLQALTNVRLMVHGGVIILAEGVEE